MRLFKGDSQRAIDEVIDFFGEPPVGQDMCGELALELLCLDTDVLLEQGRGCSASTSPSLN
jgi:hypothetical protein